MRNILEDAEGAPERGDIGPGKANRGRDRQTFPKRFYKSVRVVETVSDGEATYQVELDEKPVKTPGRNALALPTKKAAQLVAEEWDTVETEINPLLMPVTRIVNTSIDGVIDQAQAVAEDIIRYAGTDLLCYRADAPQGLVDRQVKHWDPILDWISSTHDAHFETGEGVLHVEQPKQAIANFAQALKAYPDPFSLTCLHTFTSLSGSAIIALAIAEGHLEASSAWQVAHVDEDWNISQWGEDFEAAQRRKQRWTEFDAAYKLMQALRKA